jgi:guanine deaminase
VQAHCTFLPVPSLSLLSALGTSIAHCPLSNAYFSAQPFRLREALDASVRVGLGTDIAGGYSLDIMAAMRQSVIVSRMREGERVMRAEKEREQDSRGETNLAIDWKEALYLATYGGQRALGYGVDGKEKRGLWEVGVPFDAQESENIYLFFPSQLLLMISNLK